jgi:perosamine synthetase
MRVNLSARYQPRELLIELQPMVKKDLVWFAPEMGDEEKSRVLDVLSSNFVNEGEVTTEFENEIAKICGTHFAVATTSGTMAISLALMGLGIGAGDEVIVPDMTFIATANAVTLTGATVNLVDVDPQRFTIDPDKVEAAINPRTRAVIAVDVNGRGADYDRLEPLCRKYGLFLVTDSAEALGSAWRNRKIGSIGDAGCFSFSAAKTVSTGQGGMITTNNETLHDRLRELKDQGRRFRGTGGNDLHPALGFNFKYTNLQAAVGLAQLSRMQVRLEGFANRDAWYRERLENLPGVRFPINEEGTGEHRQWTDVLFDRRDKVCRVLDERRLGNRPFWYPIHTQKPYIDLNGTFDISIQISQKGLWLPSGFGIKEEQVDFVCGVIRTAL